MAIVCRKTIVAPAILVGLFCLFAHDYWSLDFKPGEVEGKRVVVTGASRGIGRQLALHYSSLGARLLLTARDEKRLQKVQKECLEVGLKTNRHLDVDVVVEDQGTDEAAQRVIEEAVRLLGGIDVLVLNHALSTLGYWTGSSENVTRATRFVSVNYLGYLYLTAHAQKHLEKSEGSVLVVSSAAGRWPMPGVSVYAATKFAIDGFFRDLDLEFRLRNVKVSITLAVLGLIKTDRYVENMNEFNPAGMDSLAFKLGGDPSETASFIIKAAALRKREIRYPFTQMILGDLMNWFPEPIRLELLKRTVPMLYSDTS